MNRTWVLAPIVAASLALAVSAALAASSKLSGTVGPGFTITLKDAKGTTVKMAKAGTYTFVVSDKAAIHSYHLRGPGFDKTITGVGFTGTKTVTVRLKPGTYSYFCDIHPSIHGGFKVGA